MRRPFPFAGLALGLAMLVRLAEPASIQAAGPCAITLEPDTVRVGQTFVIMATGFEPNENAIGFAGLDPNESAALSIQLDASGSLTRTVTAKAFMIGTRSISLTGDLSNCGAEAELTVLAAVAAPATDTAPPTQRHGPGPSLGLLAILWILAVGAMLARLHGRRLAA